MTPSSACSRVSTDAKQMLESFAERSLSELGPCHVNEKLETYLNPYSWNEVSNMLFLSQPLGTGKQALAKQPEDHILKASQASRTRRRRLDHSTPSPVPSNLRLLQAFRAAIRPSMPL